MGADAAVTRPGIRSIDNAVGEMIYSLLGLSFEREDCINNSTTTARWERQNCPLNRSSFSSSSLLLLLFFFFFFFFTALSFYARGDILFVGARLKTCIFYTYNEIVAGVSIQMHAMNEINKITIKCYAGRLRIRRTCRRQVVVTHRNDLLCIYALYCINVRRS